MICMKRQMIYITLCHFADDTTECMGGSNLAEATVFRCECRTVENERMDECK